MKQHSQTGFGIVGLLAVVIIIGLVFTGGRYFYSRGGQSGNESASSVAGQGADAQTQGDINAISSRLESYYQVNNHYPSASNLSDEAWVAENLGGLDKAALIDTNGNRLGTSEALYVYEPSPMGCDECESFVLSAQLSDGRSYEKQSIK